MSIRTTANSPGVASADTKSETPRRDRQDELPPSQRSRRKTGCDTQSVKESVATIGSKTADWSPPREVLWIGDAKLRAAAETAILKAAELRPGKRPNA